MVHSGVHYANATAQVEFIPSVTDPIRLKAALHSIGYDLMTDVSAEPRDALEERHQQKFKALKSRTTTAILLSLPVVLIGMFFMDLPNANYIMWALSTPVVVLFGQQFFEGAFRQARHRSANMDTLVALSTGVAYLFSVFNTLFPQYGHREGLHGHVYFEAAAVVIAFILLGKLLEKRAKGHASSAIKKLMGLQPQTLTLVHEGGQLEEVPIACTRVGDTILVKPGEKVAVDGTVSLGRSFVEESMITGEPVPVQKVKGKRFLPAPSTRRVASSSGPTGWVATRCWPRSSVPCSRPRAVKRRYKNWSTGRRPSLSLLSSALPY